MKTIQSGNSYRHIATKECFRVLAVYPDEDLAIVARRQVTSTRPKPARLSALNAAYEYHQLIDVDIIEPPIPPKEVRSDAANAVFENIRPALQELMAVGFLALSKKKIWPDLVRLAKAAGRPPSTLNCAFSQVIMAGGVIEAAVPRWDKCGRKPSSGRGNYKSLPTNQPDSFHLRARDFTNIAAAARKYLKNETTWREAYDKFLEEYYPAKEHIVLGLPIITPLPVGQRPSLFQFKWHAERLTTLEERLRLQLGERKFQTEHRGKPTGQSFPAIYPGVVSEIDWTLTDLVGVARGTRLAIGRFVFYVVCDAHCGAIQSAYATMYSGNAHEAGRAILRCLEDKVQLCARYGLHIDKEDWDMTSLPVELRSDRGEIDSWKSTGLGTGLGMKLEYCPSKRPDFKGTIESFFRLLRYFLRKLRGATSGFRERLKDHPNVTAIYDFDQVQRLLFTLVIAFNARVRRRQALTVGMIAALIKPIPRELYRWAQQRGCMREFPIEDARVAVFPTHFATCTAEGIKIKGLTYIVTEFEPGTEHGIEANDWLVRARRAAWPVEVAIDISTVDHIWIRHRSGTGKPVVAQCLLSDVCSGWAGMSWTEYGLNREEYRIALSAYQETSLRETRAWTRAIIKKTTDEALAATMPLREGLSASAQISGVDERRRDEMDSNPALPNQIPVPNSDFFDEAQWGAA